MRFTCIESCVGGITDVATSVLMVEIATCK